MLVQDGAPESVSLQNTDQQLEQQLQVSDISRDSFSQHLRATFVGTISGASEIGKSVEKTSLVGGALHSVTGVSDVGINEAAQSSGAAAYSQALAIASQYGINSDTAYAIAMTAQEQAKYVVTAQAGSERTSIEESKDQKQELPEREKLTEEVELLQEAIEERNKQSLEVLLSHQQRLGTLIGTLIALDTLESLQNKQALEEQTLKVDVIESYSIFKEQAELNNQQEDLFANKSSLNLPANYKELINIDTQKELDLEFVKDGLKKSTSSVQYIYQELLEISA